MSYYSYNKKKKKRSEIRKKLLKRDGYICWLCKKEMLPHQITLDHIIPESDGGPTILSNIKLAHKKCNNHRYNPTSYEINQIQKEIQENRYNYFYDFLTGLV